MKLVKVIASNFGSYDRVELNFTNQGLTLISGPTGSGKSTLCDLVPWALFGVTAKNGAADDVRSWGSESSTDVSVHFELKGDLYYVRRIRGNKANDLYYGQVTSYIAEGKRGRDIADTQSLINNILGVDADTYLAGAYYHEFSSTAQFFNTTAKNRRQTTEQLADLSTATELSKQISLYGKELKKDLDLFNKDQMLNANTILQLERSLASNKAKSVQWIEKHEINLAEVENRFLNYEQLKEQAILVLTNKRVAFDQDLESKKAIMRNDINSTLNQIKPDSYFLQQEESLAQRLVLLGDSACTECGGPKNGHKHQVLTKDTYALEKKKSENNNLKIWVQTQENSIKQLENRVNPYVEQIEAEKLRENSYLAQLTSLQEETNPFTPGVESLQIQITEQNETLANITKELEDLKVEQSDLELLTQVVSDYRSVVIKRTISFLETSTNSYLDKHFDGEIRVKFDVETSDKLDVTITKDGNLASFGQLSKGQRQLLKLCFGLSVMIAVSNHSGMDTNCIFLDECTEGLDENMKVKVYDLLSELQPKYSSIFLVEHSEALKACFDNKIEVTLADGVSTLE